MNTIRPLLNAYVNVCFRLSPKQQVYWQHKTSVVVTAWNPFSQELDIQENTDNNQVLEREIEHRCYSKVLVSNENMSWSEESFVVETSLEEGLLLAEKYEQNAIYWVMNQHVFLVYCADKI
ncbi:DUF3293 domain-containing protein, partial [Vibrio sp. FNV 38]|nr:DUF3293 domain-containing protein [Vibrio sp. FNV 38]